MSDNKLRQFYKNHPRFRTGLDFLENALILLQKISWMCMAIPVIAVVLIAFFSLPDNINEPVSKLVGGIMSAFAFPYIIENIRVRHDQHLHCCESCAQFYEDITELLFKLFDTREQSEQRQLSLEISNYIADHRVAISLYISRMQLDRLYLIKDECDMLCRCETTERASMDSLKHFTNRFIRQTRKMGFVSGKVWLNDPLFQRVNAHFAKEKTSVQDCLTYEEERNEQTSKTTN